MGHTGHTADTAIRPYRPYLPLTQYRIESYPKMFVNILDYPIYCPYRYPYCMVSVYSILTVYCCTVYCQSRRTPHPVIVTIRDNKDLIRVLFYSYYTTITGSGVLLLYTVYCTPVLYWRIRTPSVAYKVSNWPMAHGQDELTSSEKL